MSSKHVSSSNKSYTGSSSSKAPKNGDATSGSKKGKDVVDEKRNSETQQSTPKSTVATNIGKSEIPPVENLSSSHFDDLIPGTPNLTFSPTSTQLSQSCGNMNLSSPPTSSQSFSQSSQEICTGKLGVNDNSETPKRRKLEQLDIVPICQAIYKTENIAIAVKVVEKFVGGSVLKLRVADKHDYVDILFDKEKKAQYNRFQEDNNYLFLKLQKNGPIMQFTSDSSGQRCRMEIDVDVNKVPKMNHNLPPAEQTQPEETVQERFLSIEQLFTNAQVVKDNPTTAHFSTGNFIGYVTQIFDLYLNSDKSPVFCVNVVDEKMFSEKVKFFPLQKHLREMIERHKIYDFRNFNVKLAEGKNERSILSLPRSTITPSHKNFHVPPNVGKEYIVAYTIGSLKLFKICKFCWSNRGVRSQVHMLSSVCYKCNTLVDNENALAGFKIEVDISDDPDLPIGEKFTIYDDSFRVLFQIDENLKYIDVFEKREDEYESKMSENDQNIVWDIAGNSFVTVNGNGFNIRFAERIA